MSLNLPRNFDRIRRTFIALCTFACLAQESFALGVPPYVGTNSTPGCFPLVDGIPASIVIDSNDWAGVVRAGKDLQTDIQRVTGKLPKLMHDLNLTAQQIVIVGTVGRSAMLERLVKEKKIDVSPIAGKWESFFVQVVPRPFPGTESALVICGSDKRGTIYGIYELSEQMGVSPWHFWADVPTKHQDKLFVEAGKHVQGPPSVKYRGIFLNDEAPALSGWVQQRYGTVNGLNDVANYGRGFYTNIFELLLRVRANYLWPAMWNNAFNEDDRENPRLADEYGIIMGTSHQEPMLRAQKEWDRGPGRQYRNWDYTKLEQRPVLAQFWREGIRRNKEFESIITLGLRAENDSGEHVGRELTEQIVQVQRQILAEEINPDLTRVPQTWCLYKEVMDYYREGLRVPDDVTLLWAEDNWGNVRRLPTSEERKRTGGAGIYYHFDYHGGPRSYQWINTSPIAKIWDQMSLAKQYGADRIWIVNVGHFNKSSEFPLEYFIRLAWDADRWSNANLDEFTRLWSAREFGAKHAEEIAHLITRYTQFTGRRKPELLEANTYSLMNYREFETVVAEYDELATRAQAVFAELPPESRDAFYGMVGYPIKAAAQLNAMYLAAAKNALYVKQRRVSANDFAAEARTLFDAQAKLADHFNTTFADGKWNHFMDQAYIGYRSWSPPRSNNLGAVRLSDIAIPELAAMGVAVEGGNETSGGALKFDAFGQGTRFVDVFNQGRTPFDFTATPTVPWIKLSNSQGKITKEMRIQVGVDWNQVPPGEANAEIVFSGASTNFTVSVKAFNPANPTRSTLQGFVEADGYVSMEAEHYAAKTDASAGRWVKIPNYGHTLSGLRAEGPAETLATPGKDSPCLEYQMYLFSTGKVEVATIVGPTLNFLPGRPLRYAIAIDDQAPQIITAVAADFDARNGNRDWEESVKNNCRQLKSSHTIDRAGYHTLRVWMVDPAIVLQKLVVNTGGVKPSYLGPPESFYRGTDKQLSGQR